MSSHFYILLIPLLPLAAFLVLGLFGRKYLHAAAGIIGTLVLLTAAVIAILTAYNYFNTGKINGIYQHIVSFKYTWLQFSPNVSIDMGFLLDPISMMMVVIVTFISLMVHVFSLGYMKGEGRLHA
ncbi:MAG: NADH-quinone oxidoreductase subunit L, partial [Bacteroidota bacterium]